VHFSIITLFPEMFSILAYGITGRALKESLIQVNCFNPRDFTQDRYRQVDDRPYGGGPGMVMMAEPLQHAIGAAKNVLPEVKPLVIHLSPQGKRFNQASAEKMREEAHLILIAGRYEGIDERLLMLEVDEEWSMGDYILSGGELAALTMIDVITRLLPGALGSEKSAVQDTFGAGMLKYSQYTRPENFKNLTVPPVLLGGNHKEIDRFRLKQSLGKTWSKRPDLLAKMNLDKIQLELLLEFIQEQTEN